MRYVSNNFNYFTENQLTKFSTATAGLLVNFGHTLSVGLLVRPWPYRRRRPCLVMAVGRFVLGLGRFGLPCGPFWTCQNFVGAVLVWAV